MRLRRDKRFSAEPRQREPCLDGGGLGWLWLGQPRPWLQGQLRLSIISLLIGVEKADFNFLLEETKASKGNLSVQIKKLSEAGYIEVTKSFVNNYPKTECSMTKKGIKAFDTYVTGISIYLKK